ncbi:ATP-binding cassette domain-containing protein [Solirubrobacter phytolaccae]|uniref:ATP-binding cassette domain-containing protein n=1 Tax=Solirubrobacter phytolaccae TaxID=1404360 RepID=A0A9X3S7T3_9ACTN|nr:ABC-F family ATP-binding cassette domain-containing protein [Solirubrobacter phytolaccae]MDA0180708.1 ATP-binding cassette domain-containing protein [Solirubrobacter phytolaccae]
MLKGTDLMQSHDGAPLFDGLSLTLDDGARAALVGPNGVGKTTLLRLLAGVDAPERGAVALGVGDRASYLPQDVLDPRATIDDLLRRALGEVWEVRLELDAHEHDLTDFDAYGDAQARFEALGGWALEARLDEARRRLAIEHLDRGARLGELSGGEAARCLLASVLLGDPTVLLLDEPTNHLDADGRAWLAEWLEGFDGTLLTVSHDRDFLDATVDRIYELSPEGLEAYEGGYTAYREERARRRERLALVVEAQEKKRKRLEADIAMTARQAQYTERTIPRAIAPKFKRYAKKVAKKSKAREHRLQREMQAETWVRAPREPAAFKVQLESDGGGKRLVAALRGVTVPGVLEGVDLTLHAGDRVALVGPNGSGKSTLLHLLSGRVVPADGDVDVRGETRLLPQVGVAEVPAGTLGGAPVADGAELGLLAWFRAQTSLPEAEARTLLAHYRLGSDAIDRPLARLSPGERARVHVAAIVGGGAELILLDEPTNHLDFDTLEVIEAALRGYRGTLVVATHDRPMIDAIDCERVICVRSRRIEE